MEARCQQLENAVDSQNGRSNIFFSSSSGKAVLTRLVSSTRSGSLTSAPIVYSRLFSDTGKEHGGAPAADTSASVSQHSKDSQVPRPAQEKWEIATAHLKTIIQQAEAELQRCGERTALETSLDMYTDTHAKLWALQIGGHKRKGCSRMGRVHGQQERRTRK